MSSMNFCPTCGRQLGPLIARPGILTCGVHTWASADAPNEVEVVGHRASILQIGTARRVGDDVVLSDWRMGGSDLRIGGWTIPELQEIAADLTAIGTL